MNSPDYEYSAFVSYRHLDSSEPGQQWAAWVQTTLERYTTPPELVGQGSLYGDPVPAIMARVFRDKDELPAHGDLGALIHEALEKSRVLIVLCTPAAALSPWVADEVLHFKKLGRAESIIAIVLHGKPHAPDGSEECYPPPLRYKLREDGSLNPQEREHPIYIDLRPPLGPSGATTAEEYQSLLHAAETWLPGPIDHAVIKYRLQLEEARLLLLSGTLGLAPRDLTQRDLLRQNEEASRREAEANTRAAHEAEQKRIAESARAEAESQRRQAQRASAIARVLAVVAALVAIWAFNQSMAAKKATDAAIAAKRIAENERMRADLEKANAIASRERMATARSSAQAILGNAQYKVAAYLGEMGKLDLFKELNDSTVLYYEKNPPEADASQDEKNWFQREFTVAINQQGHTALNQGHIDVALVSYRRALAMCMELSARDKTKEDWMRNVANTYQSIAIAQRMASDQLKAADKVQERNKLLDEALKNLKETQELRKTILAMPVDVPFHVIDAAHTDGLIAEHFLYGGKVGKEDALLLLRASLKQLDNLGKLATSDLEAYRASAQSILGRIQTEVLKAP